MARQTGKQGTLPFAAAEQRQRVPRASGARTAVSPKGRSEPVSGLVLRKSPERLRLDALQKEHERLLRGIDERRFSCAATEHTVREAHDAIHARAEPLRATLLAMLREIHELFDELLDPRSRLCRSDRAALQRFHRYALEGLPRPAAEAATPDERDAEAGDSGRGRAPPFAGAWPPDSNDAEHESAAKPSEKNTSLLRALYRKLAVALHPDKAREPSETARLTSLMKEVTQAYANEDLAKLVELERTWLAPSPASDVDADLERQTARLLEANGELRRQLRALTARLKDLQQSLPGVSWPRRRRPASGAELAAGLIATIEREVEDVERLRDAARDLYEGRINVAQFLAGPRPPPDEAGDPLNDLFDEMLEQLLDGVGPPRRRAGRASGARRRRS